MSATSSHTQGEVRKSPESSKQRSNVAAVGFNLLTSLGLHPGMRLVQQGCIDGMLDRLLETYLGSDFRQDPGDGEVFDVVLLQLDGSSGGSSGAVQDLAPWLIADGPLHAHGVLVGAWSEGETEGTLPTGWREQWIDQAISGGRSVEFLRLAGHGWAIFRNVEHRVMSSAVTPISGGIETAAVKTTASPEATAAPEPAVGTDRLDQEIARYRDCVEVHNLPEIYHFWSHRYVRPKLLACGFDNVDDFFLQYILAAARQDPERRHRIASIGAGNCDLEVRLAVLAREAGVDNLLFHCLELNPHMIERGRELSRQDGVEELFEFEVIDIDTWEPEEPHAVCIANHSLHHIVDLETLCDKIHRAIGDEGVFLTNDMIGRNGHMRWPEALHYVEEIWRQMPRRYKYNHQLSRWEDEFVNWDCSKEGNEGIRAEDILPLLIKRFHFDSFIAFANIIDIFVDRSFGHNFDAELQEDLDFIEGIAELDEEKLDTGEVKPTHLVAAMRAVPVAEPKTYKHWTPDFCVRTP